jgi:23S rRNA (uracil1939-C5)-methyltransferase
LEYRGIQLLKSPVAVIDKLAFGGNGVCRIEGKVCFVPFSCPGDEVRLNITSQKKSYSIGEISELIYPSPSRTVPACKIFGSCGGCNWQHIKYPVQLEQKHQIFVETLWRGARIGTELIRDVIPAPAPYGYRNRVQFKLSFCQGKLQIGFFRHGSHAVEDAVQGCPVALTHINELLKCFRAVLPLFTDLEAISQISIDVGVDGPVAIVQYSGQDIRKLSSFLIDRSSDLRPCTGLLIQTGQKSILKQLWGVNEISYEMPSLNPDDKPCLLNYRSGGFAQVNQSQNRALLLVIRRLGNFTGTENLLDLYCGNGNFSIPLAADVASVVGIEGFEDSINSAVFNSASNDVSNTEFIRLDVCNGLRRLVRDGRIFDVVLLDPPRTGAGDAVPDITRLKPDRIIYVSCDPATLARDCALLAGFGYCVAESVPVDMFPQTYHLESVTLLVKM